ncbi:hypothetical protein ACT0XK_003535 [Cronobacter sakazakii]|uniref:hypothetical protein n=1 Tax=Cronobacter sakazakii TaxID=28141 RepID=UPI000BEA1F4C|nr:hypothetical protein [Cronobacter sakazakii]ELY5945172.1 hypothetical protein [Cronobacter turicensis]EJV9473470.1 hypothetical protein [Cronobacter sakazakii]EKK7733342.1 hypothetical protein [Cronobacter sakazakii]ELY4123905.1 hypothetical protein [Cronobacter sakazakii]ELY6251553.1 hypothetical protein [Cronobacter sakazakii]
MKNESCAFSRIERACLLYAIAFLLAAALYNFIAGLTLRDPGGLTESARLLFALNRELPSLTLLCLTTGFAVAGLCHYGIRHALRPSLMETEN